VTVQSDNATEPYRRRDRGRAGRQLGGRVVRGADHELGHHARRREPARVLGVVRGQPAWPWTVKSVPRAPVYYLYKNTKKIYIWRCTNGFTARG
jgi:hypothetical protein